jgi:hypothetical protein
MRSLILVLTLIGITAVPASAQDIQQTPEGAQRFLSTVIKQYEIVAVTTYNKPKAHLAYRLTNAHSMGVCVTKFDTGWRIYADYLDRQDPIERESGQQGWSEAQYQRYIRLAGTQEPPFTIDWSRVNLLKIVTTTAPNKNISSDGRNRRVAILEGTNVLVLILPDEDLAKRVQYAMQFLKEACDKTAETGF